VTFYSGIFLRLSCLKLVLRSSSIHHHVDGLLTASRRQLASLLACTYFVSGWHKLWALMRFLDNEDDTTPDFRGFYISHEKQIVNCR
jgi:hypothetical protein